VEYPSESGWTIPCSRNPAANSLVWVDVRWVYQDGSRGQKDFVLKTAN
jgi:hypothetical protein